MKRNLLTFQFRNSDKKKYKLYLSKNPRPHEGDCDNPIAKNPIIRLRDSLMRPHRARRQMAIILEEMLHAHAFHLTEKCVRKYSANTMKLLYLLGWRWKGRDKLKIKKFKDLETLYHMLGWKKKRFSKRTKKRKNVTQY